MIVTLPSKARALAAETLIREAMHYTAARPRRIAPAESPTRPALADLWATGQAALARRPSTRQFEYVGERYAFIKVGGRLCIYRLRDPVVLVGDSAP